MVFNAWLSAIFRRGWMYVLGKEIDVSELHDPKTIGDRDKHKWTSRAFANMKVKLKRAGVPEEHWKACCRASYGKASVIFDSVRT